MISHKSWLLEGWTPRTTKWLGSTPLISNKKAIWKGKVTPGLGDLTSPWLFTTYQFVLGPDPPSRGP